MNDGRVLGAGLDLVENARMDAMMRRWGRRFRDRVFTPDEQRYCDAKAVPHRHYAGRWAVKEAVSKAFGTGISTAIAWLDIEVVNDSGSGAPSVRLSSRARRFAERCGVAGILISLSHTREYAVAQAILTGSGPCGRRGGENLS